MQLISEAMVAGSLEEIAKREEAERRAAEVEKREALLAAGGRVVAPYEPNRRQRRAQKAKLRSKK